MNVLYCTLAYVMVEISIAKDADYFAIAQHMSLPQKKWQKMKRKRKQARNFVEQDYLKNCKSPYYMPLYCFLWIIFLLQHTCTFLHFPQKTFLLRIVIGKCHTAHKYIPLHLSYLNFTQRVQWAYPHFLTLNNNNERATVSWPFLFRKSQWIKIL